MFEAALESFEELIESRAVVNDEFVPVAIKNFSSKFLRTAFQNTYSFIDARDCIRAAYLRFLSEALRTRIYRVVVKRAGMSDYERSDFESFREQSLVST